MRTCAILGLVAVLAGCTVATPTVKPAGESTQGPAPTRAPATISVTYRVTTPGDRLIMQADITYSNGQGGTEQRSGVTLTWEKTVTMQAGQDAYVSAQNQEQDGTIACDILVNGQPFRHSQSDGAYVIAQCSGIVGQP